jgi:hypothetical protein
MVYDFLYVCNKNLSGGLHVLQHGNTDVTFAPYTPTFLALRSSITMRRWSAQHTCDIWRQILELLLFLICYVFLGVCVCVCVGGGGGCRRSIRTSRNE